MPLIQPTTAEELATRLASYLPVNWFSEEALARGGNMYTVLLAFASGTLVAVDANVLTQANISVDTATGTDLDQVIQDYFGNGLPRSPGESDAAYRARFKARLFVQIGTRPGMHDGLLAATGNAPTILETREFVNGGGWGAPGLDPFEFGPIGWDTGETVYEVPGGIGAYQCLLEIQQPEPNDPKFLTYEQILGLINELKPASVVVWVRVLGPVANGGVPIHG